MIYFRALPVSMVGVERALIQGSGNGSLYCW